jgi:arylsulfatase A-like enzyme
MPADEPEVTIILLDDVGKDLISVADTPNIDTLSSIGVNFNNAWSMPTCSPTRASLLTGRFPFRHGIGIAVKYNGPSSSELSLDEVLIPEVIDVASAALGKWHLGYEEDHPNDSGFDFYAGCLWNLGSGPSNSYYKWEKTTQGVSQIVNVYATLDTANDAVKFRTFPLQYVSFNAVHRPRKHQDNPPGYDESEQYDIAIAKLEYMDGQIGRIIDNRTGYVILLGDNGTEQKLGGGKKTLLESGINVPLIITGPGVAPRVVNDLVSVVDIFATVLDIYDVDSPVPVDGVSLLSVLHGGQTIRTVNFAERFLENHDPFINRSVAIRNADYKLMIDLDGHEVLYSMPNESEISPPYMGEDLDNYNALLHLLRTRFQWQ